MNGDARALTLLIAALGGEGGGVLTSWIVSAARLAGLPVQATSIPGVAQRTGATTYYIELWPQPWESLAGRDPLLALSPAPGEVDILVASELLEAGRAIAGRWVTPERTLLIASTHRVYTTAEKMALGDGRHDSNAILRQARKSAARALLLDVPRIAQQAQAPLNSVLLGLIAGTGCLPIGLETFRAAIHAEGKTSETNVRGFEAGVTAAAAAPAEPRRPAAVDARGSAPEALLERARRDFPPSAGVVLGHAVRRLVDYQDAAYAAEYLDRLAPFRGYDPLLLAAVARHLAVRMTYEDAIRVAQAKIRPERLARIRAETGAAPGDAVIVTDFLKPGLDEMCDILPPFVARAVYAIARRWPRLAAARRGMHVRTTTVGGFLQLRLLAALRRWRRRTLRFKREREAISRWLDLTARAAARDPALAREVAECAGLLKGYGDTYGRGLSSYARIEAGLILPALAEGAQVNGAARAIAAARQAALADPSGASLARAVPGP
jgi:indolepyruvate ferredoxin oxidoreductase beta subunit